MKTFLLIILLTQILLMACGQEDYKVDVNERYKQYRREFNHKYVDQFPIEIISDSSLLIINTDTNKHNVGLTLYEYNWNSYKIDSLQNYFNENNIAKYKGYDSCLIIVNRFENEMTLENGELALIQDSSLIDKPCYCSQYPIPNFIEYSPTKLFQNVLDSTFNIYVIDAKSGIINNKYGTQPFFHMPKEWRNGYSKGVAISKFHKTVIFWTVFW